MIPADIGLAFFLASFALALSPGPDNLFVLTLSALHGWRAGMLFVVGLCTGLLVHISAVALGLTAVVMASPVAFFAIKVAGAIYLVWLAWVAFRAGAAGGSDTEVQPMSAAQLVTRGIVMNVTNPKVGVFFLALLPQFVDTGRGPVSPQVIVLGLLFVVSAVLAFAAIAAGAGRLSDWFRDSPRVGIWLNRVAGVVFVALALRLILTEQ